MRHQTNGWNIFNLINTQIFQYNKNFQKSYKFVHQKMYIICLQDLQSLFNILDTFHLQFHIFFNLYFYNYLTKIKSHRIMGTQYSKDNNIDLYIVTNKQYYIAGEYVQGKVYLNVKAPSKYNNLCLKIFGLEYVYWYRGNIDQRQSYMNRYESYSEQIKLMDFHNKVDPGQYCIPFTFLLPSMMPGSFYYSKNCYIKYTLRAQLVHPSEQKKSQIYDMFLNILQPPRMSIGPVTTSGQMTLSFFDDCGKCDCCWGCSCCNSGIITCTLNCSKNFVLNGEEVQISGLIDNTRSKETISSFKLSFKEMRIMIAGGGRTFQITDNEHPLLERTETIGPGAQRDFNFVAKIPENISNYTAIGKIVARYFILNLEATYGLCNNKAQAGLHLILHSKTPMVVQKKQIFPPSNWYPKTQPKINCQTLKPYIYNPLPQIPYLNLPNLNKTSSNQQSYSQYQPVQPIGSNNRMELNEVNNFPISLNSFGNYQPCFYSQNLFSQAEQQQQGYKGYPPSF